MVPVAKSKTKAKNLLLKIAAGATAVAFIVAAALSVRYPDFVPRFNQPQTAVKESTAQPAPGLTDTHQPETVLPQSPGQTADSGEAQSLAAASTPAAPQPNAASLQNRDSDSGSAPKETSDNCGVKNCTAADIRTSPCKSASRPRLIRGLMHTLTQAAGPDRGKACS